MDIEFGRAICGDLSSAATREWIVTNGIGGYASGTVAGLHTRRYHGLLVAALNPPLGRTLLLTKLDEVAMYNQQSYELYTNRWAGGIVIPHGYRQIEHFAFEQTIPMWRFACADALLEKRIWMQPGANITYIQYTLVRATQPLQLSLKALVNYRDYHGSTQSNGWGMSIDPIAQGVQVTAYPRATPIYLMSDHASATPTHHWYYNFELAVEQERGLSDREDHLQAATFDATLNPSESLTLVASAEPHPNLDGVAALKLRRTQDQKLLTLWQMNRSNYGNHTQTSPAWIDQLVLPHQEYDALADRTLAKFSRFWNPDTGYCYDVLDGPAGDDAALRPNQIFAVSLPGCGSNGHVPLLTAAQQRSVVDTCGRLLLTSHGLRSLDPHHPHYQGYYGGNPLQRDGAYHQGTVWGWLLGPFVLAHLQVYDNPAQARQFLAPIADHLLAHGLGNGSEIFDGDAPMTPRGCIAQAWTVAEVLRAWVATEPV